MIRIKDVILNEKEILYIAPKVSTNEIVILIKNNPPLTVQAINNTEMMLFINQTWTILQRIDNELCS